MLFSSTLLKFDNGVTSPLIPEFPFALENMTALAFSLQTRLYMLCASFSNHDIVRALLWGKIPHLCHVSHISKGRGYCESVDECDPGRPRRPAEVLPSIGGHV